MFLLPKKYTIFIIICFLVCIDLIAKNIFYGLDNILLTPVLNTWAARWVSVPVVYILVVSIIACISLLYAYYKKMIPKMPFIVICAGALWNMYDRIMYSGVRDFIDIRVIPVFNVADILITIWVIYFIFLEFQHIYENNTK